MYLVLSIRYTPGTTNCVTDERKYQRVSLRPKTYHVKLCLARYVTARTSQACGRHVRTFVAR